MTAINEHGQAYFTFEELDLEGALQEAKKEHDQYCKLFRMMDNNITLSNHYSERIMALSDVILNLRWLIKKGVK